MSDSRQLWLTVPVSQNLTVLCQKARIEAAQAGVFAVDHDALHALGLSLNAAPGLPRFTACPEALAGQLIEAPV